MVDAFLALCLLGTNCNTPQVLVQQPTPLVVQQPGFFFLVGSEIRAAALVENHLRNDPLYQEFLKWRAEQQGDNSSGQGASATAPTVRALCSKCHSGEEPKAGLTIDGDTPMTAELITASIRAISRGKMPKNMAITSNLKSKLYSELLSLEEQNDGQENPSPSGPTDAVDGADVQPGPYGPS